MRTFQVCETERAFNTRGQPDVFSLHLRPNTETHTGTIYTNTCTHTGTLYTTCTSALPSGRGGRSRTSTCYGRASRSTYGRNLIKPGFKLKAILSFSQSNFETKVVLSKAGVEPAPPPPPPRQVARGDANQALLPGHIAHSARKIHRHTICMSRSLIEVGVSRACSTVSQPFVAL